MKKVKLNMYLKHNLGDDLFLKIILEKYPESMFYIQTNEKYKKFKKEYKNLKEYSILHYLIIKVVCLFNHKRPFDYVKEKCDLMVTLGGSMFQENNIDYKILKKTTDCVYFENYIPYYIIGSNFGPYKNELYKKVYERVFSKAKVVNFREKISYDLFNNLNNVHYYPDVIFNLDTKKYESKNEKSVFISVMNLDENYYKMMEQTIRFFKNKDYRINLVSFCKNEGDLYAINKLVNKVGNENIFIYSYYDNIDEIINVLAKSSIVVATRFHATILGLLFNKTVIPIIYSQKTLNVLNDLGFKGKIISDFKQFNIEDKDLTYKLDLNIDDAKLHFKELDEVLK